MVDIRNFQRKTSISTRWSKGAQSWGLPLARVPEFALALAKWTDALFPDETASETRLRVAACAISDIAWRDQDDLRALESFRRVSQFPFIGLDHAERIWLACVIHARYAGRIEDKRIRDAVRMLSPAALRRARNHRPRVSGRPPVLRQCAGDPGILPVDCRRAKGDAEGRRRGPSARQRGLDEPPQAARQSGRRRRRPRSRN